MRFSRAGYRDIAVRNCFFADIRQPYTAFQTSGSPWGRAIAMDGEAVSVVP